MIIGCPKEIKVQEYRVGLTPEGADALVRQGHTVYVETKADSTLVAYSITDTDGSFIIEGKTTETTLFFYATFNYLICLGAHIIAKP